MTGIIDWLGARARMVMAVVLVSVAAGVVAYKGLPKEGAPDIDIPVLYVSVALPGVSAIDAERLIVKPLETELRGLQNLKEMTGIASQNHAGVLLEFDFGWDKAAALAEVRDKVNRAEAEFPEDAEEPTVTEVNLSQFPVLVVSLSGDVPERALLRLANDLQREIEGVPAVLEAELTGHREEMIEVLIDPLRMESYGVTAADLLNIVGRNNQLVAAGEVESGTAAFAVTVPGSFRTARDVDTLPVKVSGDRVVRLRDIAEIRRTFEDAQGHARYNGERAISLRVSKRVGENIISTVQTVRQVVEREAGEWPDALQAAVDVDFAMDESVHVVNMVDQLEGSVLTAVLLVMMVMLATLGFRSSLLVGFAIPASFLLTFALMAVLGMSVNNMTMFGLILAVGMLVDGAIVVVEYADKRIAEGVGPMRAYTEAARRMFWPIASSTATTLCAFLPMLFWPGVPGEFMGQLPITLIFVLSASLIVALLYLPVIGGIAGRISRLGARLAGREAERPAPPEPYRRTSFGRIVGLIVLNPIGPWVAIGTALAGLAGAFFLYSAHGAGTEFFVKTDPERAIVYVRARGNISIGERDRLVRAVEERLRGTPGIESVFAFSGTGTAVAKSGSEGPSDAVGQVQIELAPWIERGAGDPIIAEVKRRAQEVPGVITEVLEQEDGPQQGKPVQLELRSNDWAALHRATEIARAKFASIPGLVAIDDTRPLPGIEWQMDVDRATAGLYGADIASVGPIVQLVTRGATLDTIRPDDSEEEIDIRVRFPEEHRTLSTLDALKVPTERGLVPLSNFIERTATPKLGEIQRRDGERFFLVRADVDAESSDIAVIEELERWIEEENPFPTAVTARFTGDREEQQESMRFLAVAFTGALGLIFVILLAQFNSLYNAFLVLSAVVMSVAGVLIGMVVMGQKFSIIMTGTGVVALAGIVVNNNIVLIDTYQEFAARMPRLEAIVRTAEARIRPVLLTTVTTMAGLAPMMFALSLDFANGRIVHGQPTALWWVQLSTAVVWGLGIATVLTLIVTPAALALRVWTTDGIGFALRLSWHLALARVFGRGAESRFLRDWRLRSALAKSEATEILWETGEAVPARLPYVRAAE